MRRHNHSNISAASIHQQARETLEATLPWKPYKKSVSVSALLDLLLLMAATEASLFATVSRFFGFSHETASRAVRANLPSEQQLLLGLVDGLHNVLALSRLDRRRRWQVAIDTHNVCYYGQHTDD